MKFVLVFLFVFFSVGQQDVFTADQAQIRFLQLHEQTEKWRQNLFGSGRYHAWQLRRLLIDCIGEEIQTDYAWTMIRPVLDGERRVRCIFDHDSWLVIQGVVDADDPQAAAFMRQGADSWPKASMMAIRGRVKGFALASTGGTSRVVLFVAGLRMQARQGEGLETEKTLNN